jgi:TPR repeat protein
MAQMGTERLMEGDFSGAYEYWAKAAELGDAGAHYHLAVMYDEGQFVEKDMKKAMYHWEEAAIAGHPGARHNLGCYEGIHGRIDRAMKHFIIATNLGYDQSVKMLKQCYADGNISKEDFAAALRVYQAAVDATKSPQREAAERNPDFQRAVSRTNN